MHSKGSCYTSEDFFAQRTAGRSPAENNAIRFTAVCKKCFQKKLKSVFFVKTDNTRSDVTTSYRLSLVP